MFEKKWTRWLIISAIQAVTVEDYTKIEIPQSEKGVISDAN
ncbi:MAG: hypothetical protein WA130_12150 [Candidatus Methanoperedens sp.]